VFTEGRKTLKIFDSKKEGYSNFRLLQQILTSPFSHRTQCSSYSKSNCKQTKDRWYLSLADDAKKWVENVNRYYMVQQIPLSIFCHGNKIRNINFLM